MSRSRGGSTREAGFSLVLVLLVIAALSVAATLFLQVVRGYGRTVSAASAAARLEAYADAGVQIAILDLAASSRDGQRARRIPVDAMPFHCSFGPAVALRLVVQDEAGRVDLNVGSDRLIQTLLHGLRVEKADALADAILDYRDSDDNRRPAGAETDEYLAAGRRAGPRNAPFLAIDEIEQVLGVTPEIASRLRPYLTLNSGLEGVDPAAARPELAEILARGERGGEVVEMQGLRQRAEIPPDLRATSMRRSFRILADARTGTMRYVREVMIELSTSRTRPVIIKAWGRSDGADSEGPMPATPEELPRC